MIPRTEVLANLKRLEKLFNEAILVPRRYREANFYGKLAILEASAWLEQCIEDIFSQLANGKLTVAQNVTFYSDKIDDNHGFSYEKYLRNKLGINLIGLVLIEKMEFTLGGQQKFQDMKAGLRSLTRLRGGLAHTHLTGTAVTVQNVALTITTYKECVEGLKLVERHLKKIKFK